jgi:hypothetical protein
MAIRWRAPQGSVIFKLENVISIPDICVALARTAPRNADRAAMT